MKDAGREVAGIQPDLLKSCTKTPLNDLKGFALNIAERQGYFSRSRQIETNQRLP